MTKFISFFMSIFAVMSLFSQSAGYFFRPTLKVDVTAECGEVSSRASGYLYGIAQENVPDKNITESLDISSVSQKTINGLQHPTGDIDDVNSQLKNCDYDVVYLQDCFDTWYYCHNEIGEMRDNDTYDWQKFISENYFPLVRSQVTELSSKSYAGNIVYCLYNECDNGVWFGNQTADGASFDDIGKQNFYSAWKQTYNLVKSINPNALVGGPGYYEYNVEKIESFLSYCKENNCVPDVMIYHELSQTSSILWEDHTKEYRDVEKNLEISPMPVIVTEYGCMEECGNPGEMIHYVSAIEKSGTYGNVAFWRLANNLCDTCADNNSPNSNWWLYKWYADMDGQLIDTQVVDMFHADIGNHFKYNYDSFHYSNFCGIASVNDEKNQVDIICGGSDYTGYVSLENLKSMNFDSDYINIKVEGVYYNGLTGVVNSPVIVSEYTKKISCNTSVKIPCNDSSAVYKVTVTSADDKTDKYENEYLPNRFEFEKGTLLGSAYKYDSAYATTGNTNGMTGGIENDGDGVSLDFTVPTDGYYDLSIIYGNANDGTKPEDRTDSKAVFSLDGKEEIISLPNTIKSEYTSSYNVLQYLAKGAHNITLNHNSGTFVLDSLLLSANKNNDAVYVFDDSDRTTDSVTSFLAISPDDGYYDVALGAFSQFTVDSAPAETDSEGNATVYLRKGLNYIDVRSKTVTNCEIVSSESTGTVYTIKAQDMALSGTAELTDGYISGISSDGGKAEYTFTAAKSGSYRMTVTYSNNDEGGVHDYNVDLIERYVTTTVNGKSQNVWCRNTYSWDTYKTVTVNVELKAGENKIEFTNNGETMFNGNTSSIPRITEVTLNSVVK